MVKVTDNLHIIVVNDFAHVNGGASKVALTSALALDKAGYSVTLFSIVGPVMPEFQASNIEIHCLNQHDILNDPIRVRAMTQGIWNKPAADAMQQLLSKRNGKKTIVHIHGFVKAVSSSIVHICHKYKIPVVLTLHDYFTACPNGGFYNYQQQKICTLKPLSVDCIKTNCDIRAYSHKVWRVLRNGVQQKLGGIPGSISHFIYISELSRSLLEPYIPDDAELHFVPNPIDVEKTARIAAENNQHYVFIGRLSPEKGVQLFCETMSKLKYPALVIGDGDELTQFKARFPEIEFSGWLQTPAINKVLEKAKVLVFCTRWYETQGLVVYEALARGLPVIVPKHCSAAEAVSDTKNGLLYDDDAQGLGLERVIQQLQSMPKTQIKKLSETAYSSYWSDASDMQKHLAHLLLVYRSMIIKTGK